jgi:hypothetical protein
MQSHYRDHPPHHAQHALAHPTQLPEANWYAVLGVALGWLVGPLGVVLGSLGLRHSKTAGGVGRWLSTAAIVVGLLSTGAVVSALLMSPAGRSLLGSGGGSGSGVTAAPSAHSAAPTPNPAGEADYTRTLQGFATALGNPEGGDAAWHARLAPYCTPALAERYAHTPASTEWHTRPIAYHLLRQSGATRVVAVQYANHDANATLTLTYTPNGWKVSDVQQAVMKPGD